MNFYRRTGKQLFDWLISVPAFILLTPLLAITALIVCIDSPGPVLFRQQRLGKDKKVFQAYKFRTMFHRPRISQSEIIGRHPEVTRVGYWLRRFKIDELPQIFNIIIREMSFVGPRSALPAQVNDYNEDGHRRLLVRPGLTGLAQVNGNVYLSWPKRWRYDSYYVDHMSFKLDLWIIWRTIAVIIFGEEHFIESPNPRLDKDIDG